MKTSAKADSASQGTLNNLSGMSVEAEVYAACLKRGLQCDKRLKVSRGIAGDSTLSVFVRPVRGLFPKGLGINVFGQESSGSGADKIVYKVWNAVEGYDFPSIIVTYGNGRGLDRWVNWAKAQVGRDWCKTGDYRQLLGVLWLDEEFPQWLDECVSAGKIPALVQRAPTQAVQGGLF
jgi:hypothetical protein